MNGKTQAGTAGNELVIWPRRWVVVVMAVVALGFVAGGAVLVFAGDDLDLPDGVTLTLGIMAMVSGLVVSALQIHRLFSPLPALVLNKEGLTDHTSAAGAGFLGWNEISGVRVYNLGRTRMVGIELRDHKQLMSRQSGVVRLLVRANLTIGCSPVNIAENGLPMTAEKLAEEIERFRKAAAPSPDAPAGISGSTGFPNPA